jgi:predicted phosphoribosyltransferase/predicted alpha/beta-hydrolase family hydrolase
MGLLPFHDRDDAAMQLAAALGRYRGTRPVVLAIPRGAVPMGQVIAQALDGELDVVLVRKLGAPMNPELAIGSIDEEGRVELSAHAALSGANSAYVERESRRQLDLIRERRLRYREGRPVIPLAGRTVIVVDDGLATGSTMAAALASARAQGPARLVCAVPVAAPSSLERIGRLADDVVCLATPRSFHAVGQYYRQFAGVTDSEVVEILNRPRSGATPAAFHPVRIPAGAVQLEGELTVPSPTHGIVIFAHGSGSSRSSPRNRFVAKALNQRGLTTLLFDLLTLDEDRDTATRFDIEVLAQRLEAAIVWWQGESRVRHLPLGLFGASTGAAAALRMAAARPDQVSAVVSRGGRPDLAGERVLMQVRTRTLLIVGGADAEVLELNRRAQASIGHRAELVVIPGATHLFEEPGALEEVARVAGDWMARVLSGHRSSDAAVPAPGC